MSRPRFVKGPICGKDNCRSRYYYKADGQTFCRNNHLREGDVDYEIDDEEGMAGGFGNRRKREAKEVTEDDPSKRQTRVYGKAGFLIYLQALQCVLKAQLQFLQLKLSISGLESLGKQLWQALLEASEVHTRLPQPEPDNQRPASQDDSDPESSQMPNLAGSDTQQGVSEGPKTRVYRSKRYQMHSPGLLHIFSICYLSLNLLRVPITFKELHTWLINGDLLFLHSRNLLPDELFIRLDGHYHERLQPKSVPTVHRLWQWAMHTGDFLSLKAGIHFAPLNAPPVVLHYVKELFLPCKSPLGRHECCIAPSRHSTGIIPRKLKRASPEERLLALTLIVAKLFYNLDGIQRGTQSALEPPVRGPNLELFQQHLKTRISTLLGVHVASKTTADQVVHMSGKEMDEYLDYFATQWAQERPKTARTLKGAMPAPILNMFPVATGRAMGETQTQAEKAPHRDTLAEAVRELYMRTGPRHTNAKRPGQGHQLTELEIPARRELWDVLLELASLEKGKTEKESIARQ
ncbi:hypothetical protein BCR37DRAFT_412033 [Protomyces lactucae-debilis]|uniref:RRN7-type domain-containing protein n=1 Tax=Protomyces lactucae-debilis TaxID=2754530 RepID=A0A1Y2FST0_PROLT|nr:uncharacterized protein BCR37DRAFT_412033 [Protomyces lactucae-debilis]ORY86246.1 hypothetical protein BCR37DRAFT_412033 [Protomyces lactucae-debilis]